MRSGRREGAARGITFVELLIVAVVAGVLATVAIPTGLTIERSWKERQLRRALLQIRMALDAYHLDWEKGCIESDDEKGWPRDLAELQEEKELADDPQCTGEEPASSGPGGADEDDDDAPPPTRRYLPRIPADPFNEDADELDVSGWNARAYDEEPDSTSWKGDDVYDVYSGSELTALDGTKYSEW